MAESPRATTRQQFMARVREALGRTPGAATPAPPDVDDAIVRTCGGEEDLPSRFAERAGAIGMDVRRCTGDTAPQQLVDVLGELGARRIVCALGDLAEAGAIERALDAAGIERSAWRGDREMSASFDADAGVTDVAGAIAEAGSLIYSSAPARGRGLMLAPPVHVAIVRADQIVPDLLDHMRDQRRHKPGDLPAGQCLITGPSKTADIEGVLVTGVHGPGKVVVLLVE